MANFISNRKLNKDKDLPQLEEFVQAAWLFILFIYETGWDMLKTNNNNRMFRQNVVSNFISKTNTKVNDNINKSNKKNNSTNKEKQVEVVKIPPPIPPRPSKETLEKSKFYKKIYIKSKENVNTKDRHLYAQALTSKVNEILKLKEKFSNLSNKKIESIHNTINNSRKIKLRINLTTKEPSWRQIIIPMGNGNKVKFMISSNLYITNLNRVLKNIKSDVMADFVRLDQYDLHYLQTYKP